MDAANEFIVANALKTQVPKHWTGTHWYYANKASSLSEPFYRAYVEKTGNKMPMGWAGEAQAAVAAYAAAIEKAGTTETKAVIAAAGGSFEQIVKVTIFLTDFANFAKVNEVMAEYCKAPYPARSTVAVAALPRNARVEVECTLHLG